MKLIITGIVMEHSPSNVLCLKGYTPQAVTSNRGKNVTIIAAGNAAGTRIPPYYVFRVSAGMTI